jgi:inosine-uridine nucleoside N-ribohydrolase
VAFPEERIVRRFIIDTDPGVDDALALLLAFASKELHVEAITIVAGNVGVDLGARNALLTIDAAGLRNAPLVAVGAFKPLDRESVDAAHVHGADGLGGAAAYFPAPTGSPAEARALDLLLETISYNPNEISLLAIGPLTNLAHAFLADPGTMALVQEIIVMGGVLRGPGNATPTAEYNFYADPEAARIVLTSGAPITLVGLDATRLATVSRDEMKSRADTSLQPAAAFAERICRRYFDVREMATGRPECILHDPLAVGVAVDPSFVRTERNILDVETEGRLTTGMVVGDHREGTQPPSDKAGVAVAVETDAERFRGFFLDRVFG